MAWNRVAIVAAVGVLAIGVNARSVAYGQEEGQPRAVETVVAVEGATGGDLIRAFLSDEAMAGWWKTTRTLVQEREGGVWAIAWDGYYDDPRHFYWTGRITEIDVDGGRLVIDDLVMLEPDRPILYGPMRLELTAKATQTGAQLTVRHDGYQRGADWDQLYEEVVVGWEIVLARLKEWAERSE